MDASFDVGPESPLYWERRWARGQTGWDTGSAAANLAALIAAAQEEGALKPGAAVLEPGCGRAHNGAALAAAGYRVTSFDVAAEAIAKAKELYGSHPGLTLAVQDALTPVDAWVGQFDVVLDRAVLCALPRAARRRYVDVCFQHLRPGGYFLSLLFTELRIPETEGPPFQVTVHDAAELLQAGFSLIHAEERRTGRPDDRIAAETVAIWRRRPKVLVEHG